MQGRRAGDGGGGEERTIEGSLRLKPDESFDALRGGEAGEVCAEAGDEGRQKGEGEERAICCMVRAEEGPHHPEERLKVTQVREQRIVAGTDSRRF